jgi:plastocyanin
MVFARAKLLTVIVVVAVICAACIGNNGNTRTVLVDFQHDQFASSFLHYFPDSIAAHPGDTIVFRQTWTGEPHSVTMGTLPDRYAEMLAPYFKLFAKGGYAALPSEEPKDLKAFEEKNLTELESDSGVIQQNGAQPCVLAHGAPPRNPKEPCTKAHQKQPAFNGRQSYYNSGLIPYDGPNGDTYTVHIAADAKPGRHFFYCNYHGPFMSGFLTIKPKSARVPSQTQVSELARKQIDKDGNPLLDAVRSARKGQYEVPPEATAQLSPLGLTKTVGSKTYFNGWFAGLGADKVDTATINEFIPKRLTAKVGQKLTWLMIGGHTISFNPPKYFPIIQKLKNGTLRLNPKLRVPHGPKRVPDPTDPSKGQVFDAGSWDGRGFWSSGYVGSEQFLVYSVRITRPGTYNFACLVHPPMVGTIVVR